MISMARTSIRGERLLACLSVRQPWAWLIVNAGKDIENRRWRTSFRGRFMVHASKGMTLAEYRDCRAFLEERLPEIADRLPAREELQYGGTIGEAILRDCVDGSVSPWFTGPHGFVISDARPLEFVECRGSLGFFRMPAPVDAVQ